jgi:ABC-type multidrug transport system fused ATPase/permease subunit
LPDSIFCVRSRQPKPPANRQPIRASFRRLARVFLKTNLFDNLFRIGIEFFDNFGANQKTMISRIVFDAAQTAVAALKKINLAGVFGKVGVFKMRLKSDKAVLSFGFWILGYFLCFANFEICEK